jgi:membrane protease subunit HflC
MNAFPLSRVFQGLVVLWIVLSSTLFTLSETRQALVVQFGEPRRVIQEAGLQVKVPFVQDVIFFDKRLLDFDLPAQEMIAGDQERIVVDAMMRYRVTDPLLYYQTVQNEMGLNKRLITIVHSALRSALGNYPLAALLSGSREEVMHKIRAEVGQIAKGLGIDVVDVRIRRADLPGENSKAIFRRMATEREVMAKELRSVGGELAARITAAADREKAVLIAEAERQAQEIRGAGDAEAIRVYAEAYGQDPSFFDFYRSMQAYRHALEDSETMLVLSPKSEFLKYFR